MLKRRFARSVVIVGVVVVGIVGVVSGQVARSGQAPASGSAAMDDLLAEVRALRVELNAAASRGIRAQLLVARLQLQEERINGVARQLTDVRQQLATLEQGRAAMEWPLKAFGAEAQNRPVPDRDQTVWEPLKAILEQQQRREKELRGQESSLLGLLASEETRWLEFNGRLDELEGALPVGAPH